MITQRVSQLAAGYTQQTLYDFVKAELIAAGWGNPIDEYAIATTKHMVFKPITAGSFAARMHLRVEVAVGFGIQLALADGWDTATHTSTKEVQSLSAGTPSATGSVVSLAVYTSADFFGFVTRQSNAGSFAAAVLLEPVHSSWDTALYLPWLMFNGINNFYMPSGSGKNPWNSSASSVYQFVWQSQNSNQAADTVDNKRMIVEGGPAFNSYGIQAYAPSDLGTVGANGSVFWDTYTVDAGEVWTQIEADTFSATVLRTT